MSVQRQGTILFTAILVLVATGVVVAALATHRQHGSGLPPRRPHGNSCGHLFNRSFCDQCRIIALRLPL